MATSRPEPDAPVREQRAQVVVICSTLVAAGGVVGAIGIVNPRRAVEARTCPGGQLVGVPLPAVEHHGQDGPHRAPRRRRAPLPPTAPLSGQGRQRRRASRAARHAKRSRSGHQVFVSNDGGNSCSATGIDDNGALPDGGSFTGFGKLYYDRLNGSLVEPALFDHGDGSFGVGISTMPAGGSAFTPHEAVRGTSMFAHWPAIALDAAGTVYLVWDTDDRQAGTSGGCTGAPTPAPNSVMLVSITDPTTGGPLPTARPLFIRQNGGPRLIGTGTCS